VTGVTRVILLDDNPDMVATMKLLLEDGGVEVVTCLHAAEALRAQRERTADVLVTDIFMPDADGLEVIQHFRKTWPDTRIVAISGGGRHVKGDYLEIARMAGADIALRKPVDPNELIRIVLDLAPPISQ
jgi:CheY-like chemotaxis protein